jgi:hypothetical protein
MSEFVEICGGEMNLTDANLKPSEGGFQSIEPGTYDFEVTKAVTGTSAKGNNVLKVTGKVVGPEDSPMLKRTMTNSYVMSSEQYARERMLNFLQASQAEFSAAGFSLPGLIGLQFTADVETRQFEAPNNMGQMVTKDFTSWVRERIVGTDQGGNVAVPAAAAAPAQTAAPAKAATVPPNAARRPAAPNGNGAARR